MLGLSGNDDCQVDDHEMDFVLCLQMVGVPLIRLSQTNIYVSVI